MHGKSVSRHGIGSHPPAASLPRMYTECGSKLVDKQRNEEFLCGADHKRHPDLETVARGKQNWHELQGRGKGVKGTKKKDRGDIKEDESEELGALSIMMMGEHVVTKPPRLTDSLAFSKGESNPVPEDSASSIQRQ